MNSGEKGGDIRTIRFISGTAILLKSGRPLPYVICHHQTKQRICDEDRHGNGPCNLKGFQQIKYIPYTATSGAIGWGGYLIVQNSGNSSMMAAFVSTLVVAVSSHMLARLKKAPVTV